MPWLALQNTFLEAIYSPQKIDLQEFQREEKGIKSPSPSSPPIEGGENDNARNKPIFFRERKKQ
jgi:hypothetical protein